MQVVRDLARLVVTLASCVLQKATAQCLKVHFDVLCHSWEVVSIHGNLVQALPCVEERNRCCINVIKRQVFDVCQWNACIVHSDAAFTLRCRIQQS